MKSRFISDLQDSFDGQLTLDGPPVFTNFFPASFLPWSFYSAIGHGSDSSSTYFPLDILPTPALPTESVQAEAAVTQSGTGGTGSVVAVTSSGGFTINLIFDSAAMAAPASFRAGIEQAASILSATITNKITVNVSIDYSGTGGGAAAGPDNGLFENYTMVRADLIANAAPGDTSFNALPNTTTIQGQSQVAVWNAQLKLFGLISPNSTSTDDGSATFATDINSNLLVGVALHELTHALGRVPYGQPDGPQPDIFDFYRFTSAGSRLFKDNIPASAAYFSLDGGNTKVADFGISSDPSDFLNSGAQGPNDPFNEFYSGSTLQSLTNVDKQLLDELGFNTILAGIALAGTTSEALQGGAAVSLLSAPPAISDPTSNTLSSATIKIANAGGDAVAGDELFVNGVQNGSVGNGITASWNAATGTLTLTGSASTAVYDTLLSEISYQDTGNDTSSGSHPVRAVTWTVGDGTNTYSTTSQITIDRLPVTHSDAATNAAGSTTTATAATGVLSNDSDLDGDKLTATGISDVAKGAGTVGTSLAGVYGHLTLNADGSYSYVADNFSAINGAPTGSHLQDAFTYTVSDGKSGTATGALTFTLDRVPVVTASNAVLSAGTSVATSSLITASDPDGDMITTYAFKDTGAGHFVLSGVVQANNQEIDVTAAQLSQLTYQSAAGSPDTLQVRVNDGTAWSNWTSFTVTGSLVIEASGSTSLVQVGSNYFLNPVGGGTGPELIYAGAPVTAGMFGAWWAPVSAEQVGSGYDVAWLNSDTGVFSIWSTDGNGNYITNLATNLSATSATLESYETTFHQDLNGDHIIGPPPLPTCVIEAVGSTSLVQVGSNYFLNPVGGGTGPELIYAGAPVKGGMFGAWWAPVGAEQVGSGYDVAWLNSDIGVFSIWSTDGNGNYITNLATNLSATSATLESYEKTFHQDLNRDGVAGIYAAPSTTLLISTPLTGTSGSATIGTGATLELAAADSASVTFNSSTGMLKLDNPSTFSGPIFNFTGNGSLSGSDQIDLKGINYNSVHDSYSNGVLTVSDGTNTAALDFNGSYTLANFKFAADGSGGTIVYDPPAPKQPAYDEPISQTAGSTFNSFGTANQDSFVFTPNFGQVSIVNFTPAKDTIQFSKTVFTSVSELMAATHDDPSGNAVITDAAHDTITIQHVTTAQLLAHLSDFHVV